MKQSWIIWGLLACIVLVVPACKDDEVEVNAAAEIEALLDKQDQEIAAYLEDNNITATKAFKGFYRQEVQENPDGELVERGDVAIVQYKISRLDGTPIDASAPGKPYLITFSNDRTYFPSALYYGLINVRVGGTYRYYSAARYGYNTSNKKYSNANGIQESSIIVLEYQVQGVAHSLAEIEALEQANIQSWLQAENITAEALPNGLHKKVLQAGSGEQPDGLDSVQVYYKGYYLNKTVFDENTSGDGFKVIVDKTSLIPGFTQAIKTMQPGEKAMFIMPSAQAYGKAGGFVLPHADFKAMQEKGFFSAQLSPIPPFSTLIFELELKSLHKK